MKLKLEHSAFSNWYIQNAHQKKQYHWSFWEEPNISTKNDFYTFTLGQTWQNKINKTRIRTLYIWKFLYKACCSRRESISLFFPKAPKTLRKNDCYTFTLGQTWSNTINEIKIRALYIFKLLYTGCSRKEAISLVLLGST